MSLLPWAAANPGSVEELQGVHSPRDTRSLPKEPQVPALLAFPGRASREGFYLNRLTHPSEPAMIP